jgi:uridine kinase
MMTAMLIIAIAGPSGSGKSSIAQELRSSWSAGSLEIVELDRYYRDLTHVTESERKVYNFDSPDALESDLLFQHIDVLCSGQSIELPRYNFATHVREPAVDMFTPPDVLVVEGLFALYWAHLREKSTLRVFVDLDSETCLDRRLRRDSAQRSRDEDSVIEQFRSHVDPMREQFVTPTRATAHVTVSGLDPVQKTVKIIKSHFSEETQS